MNRLKRQLFLTSLLLPGIIVTVLQVTMCSNIFEIGSLPPIHGKITTSLADRGTAGLGCGSFKVTRCQNGGHPDPFDGSMGNVSCRPALILLQRLMDFPFHSWRREECTLVRKPFDNFVSRTYGVGQFYNYPGY